MRVVLVRHAIAPERDRARWSDDSLRPLTPAGEKSFRKAARGLKSLVPKSAIVLTSPFVRARQTARILSKVARLRAARECPELAADAPPRKALPLLRNFRAPCVILVGHEPALGRLLAIALAGDRVRVATTFKKGGAVCIRFDSAIDAGRATLEWMLPPRVLRTLRRAR
jgi:phosphohistidine phosphatase